MGHLLARLTGPVILTLCFVCLHGPAYGRDSFCPWGCPSGASAHNVTVKHHVLELSNNPTTKFADWVAYKISRATIGASCARNWARDPKIDPNSTLLPTDYKDVRSELSSDRGHQAPLASLCGSRFRYEANYLSNITPQKADLNEGPWERLEAAERNLVKKKAAATVYSITGPLYEHAMTTLPHAHVSHVVPSGYWKLIAIRQGHSIEAAAFIMDQSLEKDGDFCDQRVTMSDIESRSDLTFFPELSTSARAALNQGEDLWHDLGCQ